MACRYPPLSAGSSPAPLESPNPCGEDLRRVDLERVIVNPGMVYELASGQIADLKLQAYGILHVLSTAYVTARHRERVRVSRPEDSAKLLDATEIAELFHVTKQAAYELMRKGDLPAVTIGKKYRRVRLKDATEYLANLAQRNRAVRG